jgi:hypothetical protein
MTPMRVERLEVVTKYWTVAKVYRLSLGCRCPKCLRSFQVEVKISEEDFAYHWHQDAVAIAMARAVPSCDCASRGVSDEFANEG